MDIATSHATGFQGLAPGEVKAVLLFKFSFHPQKRNSIRTSDNHIEGLAWWVAWGHATEGE